MLRCGPRARQSLGIAGFARDADVEGGTSARSSPGGEGRAPECGGEHSVDPPLGARHELVDDVRDGPRTLERSGDRIDRLPDIAQRPAQPLQPLTLLGRQLNQQDIRVGCAVPGGAARRALRRTASDQSFQGGIRVRSRDPGHSRRGVAGGWPELEQGPVKARFGWSEPKRSKVNLSSSNSNYY